MNIIRARRKQRSFYFRLRCPLVANEGPFERRKHESIGCAAGKTRRLS